VTARLVAPKYALLSGTAVLLLGVWNVNALASNGFDTHCTEASNELPAAEIPAPSLAIKVAEHGLSSAAADMDAPVAEPGSESVASPALAGVTTEPPTDEEKEPQGAKESTNTARELPGTALRLPGVSDADLPRFRRQMYRTDI